VSFSLIDATIIESDALHPVERRAAGVYDAGNSNRFTPGAIEADARVRMDIQTRGITLGRDLPGDTSTGAVDIYVTADQLAAAYDINDPGTPLGWTGLRVAPAEYTEGPPGDRVTWAEGEGPPRIYEVTREEPYNEVGPLIPSGRRYVAEDRGAA
jgi:hypothetical protein